MMPDSSRLRTRRRHGGAVRPTFSESATFVVRPSSCNVRRMRRSIGSRTAVPAMLFHLVSRHALSHTYFNRLRNIHRETCSLNADIVGTLLTNVSHTGTQP